MKYERFNRGTLWYVINILVKDNYLEQKYSFRYVR
jgi:hypothetical protein